MRLPKRLRHSVLILCLGGLLAAALAGSAIPRGAAQTPPLLNPETTPLWLRYPSISPDGETVAFAFRGHLFTAPVGGGEASALTAGPSRDFAPTWSPDSQTIAYASDIYGNFDVFTIPSSGGNPVRLTTHSADEVPTAFTPDGKAVLFSAHRMDSRLNAQFPAGRIQPELYQVSVEPGHAPEQILTTPALWAHWNRAQDKLVYEDLKGYENIWRKHEKSSIAHDIWLYDAKAGTHTQLTHYIGEDRNPVWAPDEKSIYYLSEQSGTSNVWQLFLDHPDAPVQITRFEKNPVRFLSISDKGELCFDYDGEIYLLDPNGVAPRKLTVQISVGDMQRKVETVDMGDGVTEMALNPDGKEVAFVIRGEIYVTSVEYGITKRITNTPSQERSVSFSPDGRRLLFAGETDKSWNLYEASIVQKKEDEPYFYNSTVIDIKPILDNGQENFDPKYSPDGKEVVYLENRSAYKVLNLASKQSRVILSGDKLYSYQDGDEWIDWSPDGKWFVFKYLDTNRWGDEVGLIDAEGKGPLVDLSQSGYSDEHPVWTLGGQAILWATDRDGLHGDGGGGVRQSDVYAMFFNQKAYDRFHLSKAELEVVKKAEDDAKKEKDKEKEKAADKDKKPDDKDKKPDDKDKDKADDAAAKPDPSDIDLKNIEDRKERLSINSSRLMDYALTPDGEQLIYLSRTDEGFTLWQNKLRDKETKQLAELPEGQASTLLGDDAPAQLIIDKDGKNVFVLAGGALMKVDLGSGKPEPVKYAAQMNLDRSAERTYMFDHVWRLMKENFYVADMNGVDWDGYKAIYQKFLPFIANNYDFAELLSEMLGELNASHTGSGYRPTQRGADDTAALGVFYEESYHGPGLQVAEIIEGGPLQAAKSKIAAGMIIEKINGVAIEAGADWCPLLNHLAGRPTLLSVFDPAKNVRFDETVKPIKLGEENELLYKRWVKTRREAVDKLSGGKLGYLHVAEMNDSSFRETFSELLGRDSGKEGVIVDTRFNGGGNLHDELATLLSGHDYLQFVPRGQSLGWEPVNKWTRKSTVLISESNYSDAHLFPWVYRDLGIGKLVGMPVPGTGTAVWWEQQQDPTLYFGIPEVAFRDAHGDLMEHANIEPDVKVENDPHSVALGEDKQLEAGVKLLLGE